MSTAQTAAVALVIGCIVLSFTLALAWAWRHEQPTTARAFLGACHDQEGDPTDG